MIQLETLNWGLKFSPQSTLTKVEVSRWLDELRAALHQSRGFMGVWFDLSRLGPVSPEVREPVVVGQKHMLQRGIIRCAVSISHPILGMQWKRISTETGFQHGERLIDSRMTGWEEECLKWARDGVEPSHLFVSGNTSSMS
jgi:hypothetical protein